MRGQAMLLELLVLLQRGAPCQGSNEGGPGGRPLVMQSTVGMRAPAHL